MGQVLSLLTFYLCCNFGQYRGTFIRAVELPGSPSPSHLSPFRLKGAETIGLEWWVEGVVEPSGKSTLLFVSPMVIHKHAFSSKLHGLGLRHDWLLLLLRQLQP